MCLNSLNVTLPLLSSSMEENSLNHAAELAPGTSKSFVISSLKRREREATSSSLAGLTPSIRSLSWLSLLSTACFSLRRLVRCRIFHVSPCDSASPFLMK